ncbi:hypothetical protein Sjap_018766 [Stephania japonica]|uniref:Uncharacterized protein n=1 Tax=Stephania japonica TaxID=461633 RepID=A0AAP0I8I5_9MAGN
MEGNPKYSPNNMKSLYQTGGACGCVMLNMQGGRGEHFTRYDRVSVCSKMLGRAGVVSKPMRSSLV